MDVLSLQFTLAVVEAVPLKLPDGRIDSCYCARSKEDLVA